MLIDGRIYRMFVIVRVLTAGVVNVMRGNVMVRVLVLVRVLVSADVRVFVD